MISIREIEAIVREFPASFQPTRVVPLGMAGGMSGAQFWRVASPGGVLAVRQWPSEHPTPERLRFIHDVLFYAGMRGVAFLAVPIRTNGGESFVSNFGHLWEMSPWMPGAADYEQSPSEQKLRAAMAALAQVHIAVNDFPLAASQRLAIAPNAVSRHLSRLQSLAGDGTNELSQAIADATWPELGSLARRFVAPLPKIVPRAIGRLEPLVNVVLPTQPCLRDIWHDHVLFTGDKVTGIVDFGAIDIDTPATDIARLLGSLVGDDAPGWRAGIDAYSSVRSLTTDEDRAARALDSSGAILAGCNWLRWIFIDGRQFEDRARIIARFRRLVERSAAIA